MVASPRRSLRTSVGRRRIATRGPAAGPHYNPGPPPRRAVGFQGGEGGGGGGGDVPLPADVAGAVDRCLGRFGRLDVLVNAAGILEPTRFLDISPEEWARVVEGNLTGAFLATHAVARPMRDRG